MAATTKTARRERLPAKLEFRPLAPERWKDFEALFGERGACGGCWCMYWRLPRAQFNRQKGASNKRALHRLVASGEPLGVIAYDGELPVGWCARTNSSSGSSGVDVSGSVNPGSGRTTRPTSNAGCEVAPRVTMP